MAETTTAPNNVALKFKGKSMAKKPKSGAIAGATPSPSADKDDWEAQDALRTIQRAQDHSDNPDMMKRVNQVAQKQMDGLSKLQKQGLVSDSQAEKMTNRRTTPRT